MRTVITLLALAAGAIAQTLPNAVPMPTPEIQYLDSKGNPLAGAKLCTYAAGTSTPLATYTDSTAGTPNTNPIILDSYGRASVWVGPQLYKFVLRTGGDGTCTTGAVQWTQDNVADTTLYFTNFVKTAGTCTLITFQPTESGTAIRTCSAKLGEFLSVEDFGAVGDNSTDNSTAFAAMATWVSAHPRMTVWFPCGIYQFSTGTTITQPVTLAGGDCATLNYSGSGNMMTFGPTGLNISTYQPDLYAIEHLRFTGGGSATNGFRFNQFLTAIRIEHNSFWNFNPTGAVMSFAGNNWDLRINSNNVDGSLGGGGSPAAQSVVYPSTDTVLNSTKLTATDNHFSAFSSGWGIRVRGATGLVSGNKIEGYEPNVWVDSDASNVNMSLFTQVIGNYFETTGRASVPCVGFSGNTNFVLSHNYCNVHNSNPSTQSFLGPMNSDASTVLQGSTIADNFVFDLKTTSPPVPMISLLSATSYAVNNVIEGNVVYTAGSGIVAPGPNPPNYLVSNFLCCAPVTQDSGYNGFVLTLNDFQTPRLVVSPGNIDQVAVNQYTWSGYPVYYFNAAGGTHTSPTAELSGNGLGEFGAFGYDGTTYSGGAGIRVKATENYGPTNHGARLDVQVNPNANSGDFRTQNPAWVFDQDTTLWDHSAVTFAQLSAISVTSEPKIKYCTDCKPQTPASCSNSTNVAACTCVGGGFGAWAKRTQGTWNCQ